MHMHRRHLAALEVDDLLLLEQHELLLLVLVLLGHLLQSPGHLLELLPLRLW